MWTTLQSLLNIICYSLHSSDSQRERRFSPHRAICSVSVLQLRTQNTRCSGCLASQHRTLLQHGGLCPSRRGQRAHHLSQPSQTTRSSTRAGSRTLHDRLPFTVRSYSTFVNVRIYRRFASQCKPHTPGPNIQRLGGFNGAESEVVWLGLKPKHSAVSGLLFTSRHSQHVVVVHHVNWIINFHVKTKSRIDGLELQILFLSRTNQIKSL